MDPEKRKPLLEDGTVLNGKWEILEHLATGGKGEVYRARQTNLDREVVVKTISVEYLAEFGDDREEVNTEIQRFHREALAMAHIRHPYVVQIYDQDAATIVKDGEEVTIQYVVMEYVPGARTLRDTMPYEGYKASEKDLRHWIRMYFLPMFDGLETVHALGIVHRDMKPENVLLDGSTPKITDFGIAGGPRWAQLTRSHHVEGTITYMAPEQFMDLGETEPRADVYALGKILYEAVQGKMVDSKTACPLKGVCLSNPATPFLKELDLIIQRATAEDKEIRTPSVKALREAIGKVLAQADVRERPLLKGLHRKQLVAVAVVVLVIAAVSNLYHHFVMTHESPAPPSESVPGPSSTVNPQAPTHQAVVAPQDETPPPTLTGKDGAVMRLVPGGRVTLPSYVGSEAGKPVDVVPFYMDETEVTNYKYVEFLNQALPRIQVSNGTVRGDGRPWLLLGPVYGGYEPIIYRDGRFSLKDASAAAHPVVKVTGYGASAYAEFFGARLPYEREWLHAAGRGPSPLKDHQEGGPETRPGPADLKKEMEEWLGAYREGSTTRAQSSPSPEPSQVPYPVTRFDPNVDGIRGLRRNVSEWGLRLGQAPSTETQYVILAGLRGSMVQDSTLIPGIAQDPGGAFEDVGFRCAVNITRKEK